MPVTDKYRYHRFDPDNDIEGLGKNEKLKPLDSRLVRCQLSLLDPDSISDRETAAKFLLNRIVDYYKVIGYVGPYMSGKSEIGFALGEWIVEHGHKPWREAFCTTNAYQWGSPQRIFNSVRYASYESSLLLAAWEITSEVPESSVALKRSAWAARNAIIDHCGHHWPNIRNRFGSKRMIGVLKCVLAELETCIYIQDDYWLGRFVYRKQMYA